MKISQTHQSVAMAIKLARRSGNNPDYQAGILAVACEIATSEIPGNMRNLFLMLCGFEPHEIPVK